MSARPFGHPGSWCAWLCLVVVCVTAGAASAQENGDSGLKCEPPEFGLSWHGYNDA